MKQVLTLLIFSAVFFSSSLFAQQKSVFNIKGTVMDTTSNTPVQFSTLSIATKAEPDKQVKVLATDDKGSFQVSLNSVGEYILSVFYFGNKAVNVPFAIEEGQKTIDLGAISITDIGQLDEALVVAQKPLVKVELDKLTYDTESDPDSRTETALEMLKKVPMVTVDGEDKIQLRGSTSFKVYVNGKPSTMITNNPSEVLKSMPASNIKNIEIITDPGAKYDAEGIGGIINIIMAKSGDDGYMASVNASTSTEGGYGGGMYLTVKYGKLGLSGNYGYNYWTRPADEIYIEQLFYSDNSMLTQSGKQKNKGPNQWGSGELSYEFDSLNLVTISFDRYYGKSKTNSGMDALGSQNGNFLYSYVLNTKSEQEWGSTEINANYQRSFKKKGMLLIASYQYGSSPNDRENESEISNVASYLQRKEQSWNDASTNEHTFQVDYVNPIKNKHTVEVGAKYIIRLNNSDMHFDEFDFGTNSWVHNPNRENNMDYRQDIISGYGSYSYKLKKWGLMLGLRAENTSTDATFQQSNSISNNTIDVVPSAALSYQLAATKTLRFNYNMRIRRPSIRQLNSFVNDNNPANISYGNPNLESERINNLSLSYGSFSQKFNMNLTLGYAYTDKAIEQYAFIQNGVMHTTYGNIGEEQRTSMDMFASWTPIKDLRLMVNSSIGYTDIKSNNLYGDANSGFSGNLFANASYTFLKSFRASVYSGYYKNPIGLQEEMDSYSFLGFQLGKDFFDKKLSTNIGVMSPFKKKLDVTMKTRTRDFSQDYKMHINWQSISFRISYKFGNLKNQQIKKVQRSITNDDLMQSGNNASGAGNTPTTN